MLGKIRKKLITDYFDNSSPTLELVCPICDRKIPNSQKDAHHLVPKSKGGKTTQYLHRICHRQIHALFSETKLAKELNTNYGTLVDRLNGNNKNNPTTFQYLSKGVIRKKVIDISTGQIWNCVKDAVRDLNLQYGTLISWLNGINKNPTTLRYLNTLKKD